MFVPSLGIASYSTTGDFNAGLLDPGLNADLGIYAGELGRHQRRRGVDGTEGSKKLDTCANVRGIASVKFCVFGIFCVFG